MLGIKIWHDYFLHKFFMFIQMNNANQLPFNQILADRITINTEPDN